MNTRTRIKILLLKTLAEMDGIPLTEAAALNSVRLVDAQILKADFDVAVRELSDAGYVCGNTNQLTHVTSWTLTDIGAHQAKQL